jgi:hypothetical protein
MRLLPFQSEPWHWCSNGYMPESEYERWQGRDDKLVECVGCTKKEWSQDLVCGFCDDCRNKTED